MTDADARNHPDVGSASFQWWHTHPDGHSSRFCFTMKVGDSPDFWRARLLMPGAEFGYWIFGVIEAGDIDGIDGALEMDAEEQGWWCHVKAGRSVFWVELHCRTRVEAVAMCREIGCLRLKGEPSATRWERWKAMARFFWERRPVVKLRSPLDCM